MGDFRRENARFSFTGEIFVEEMRDFQIKWGICEEKTRDVRFNGEFAKTKRVIFA